MLMLVGPPKTRCPHRKLRWIHLIMEEKHMAINNNNPMSIINFGGISCQTWTSNSSLKIEHYPY